MPLKLVRPDRRPTAGSILIYGRPGTGKTTMLGTLSGNAVLIDTTLTEGGDFVLSDKADRIQTFQCTTWDEIQEVYEAVKSEEIKPNWLGIDSLTGMEKLAKRKILEERSGTKVNLKLDPEDLTDTELDKMKLSLPEYGQMANMIEELVVRFNKLNLWKVWTAQERKQGGSADDEGPVQIGPDLISSSLRAASPPMFMVGRLAVAQDANGVYRRTFRTGIHPIYICKVRALPNRRMPALTSDINLNKIMSYLLADGERPREIKESYAAFTPV